ncbi:MAG TPA: hypothetical protein VGA07_08480 [Anaerolineales bacterium]
MIIGSLAILAGPAGACGPAPAPPEQQAQASATHEPTATSVDVSTETAQASIIYERSGGFAGITERWMIYRDGRVVSGEGREYAAEPEKVEALLSEIEQSGFFGWQQASGLPGLCRDCFVHSITLATDGRPKTLSADDGSNDAPAKFWELVDSIRRFLGEVAG